MILQREVGPHLHPPFLCGQYILSLTPMRPEVNGHNYAKRLLAEAISIFPFLYSVALRLYPQMNAQSLGSRKKESARDSGSKRGLYIILRVTLLLAPHSLVLSLFLLASDCYDCLSPQEAHNAQLQNTRKACGTA